MKTKPYKPSVLLAREKHGTRVFNALTEADLHASALLLVRERLKEEWYSEPEKPEEPDVPVEQAKSLPDGPTKRDIMRQWSTHEGRMRSYKKDHAVWADITVAVGTGDGALAWRVLQDRNGYEYEDVELSKLEGGVAAGV